MAIENVVTLVGNLTADPELRFTTSGLAVASFTIAHTPRFRNGEVWEDGDTLFISCSLWREAGEHMAEGLTRGTRVIVVGRMKQENWEDKEGNKRTAIKLDVDELGASCKFAVVTTRTAERASAEPAPETRSNGRRERATSRR